MIYLNVNLQLGTFYVMNELFLLLLSNQAGTRAPELRTVNNNPHHNVDLRSNLASNLNSAAIFVPRSQSDKSDIEKHTLGVHIIDHSS